MTNTIDEFVKNFSNSDKTKQKYKTTPYKESDSKKADKYIKHCRLCNKCWERDRRNPKRSLHIYENFPTYGKEKEVCPICKN